MPKTPMALREDAMARNMSRWLAGLAVLAGRMQLIASAAIGYDARHLIDPVLYSVFFLATAAGM